MWFVQLFCKINSTCIICRRQYCPYIVLCYLLKLFKPIYWNNNLLYSSFFFIIWHSPEGIMALCSDLGVAHTDLKILMFAWWVLLPIWFSIFSPVMHMVVFANIRLNFLSRKLKAEKQGYFTKVSQQITNVFCFKVLKGYWTGLSC